MATNPLMGPKFRAFDSNGDPLSGGKLYAYAAGTSTPLDTYTTRAGSVANANPVVLDANGEADVWMTPGVTYKFVLKNSSDVTQWTVDNFPSAGESASTDDASVDPGGRLTLTDGTPVTTSDVTGQTTIYYEAYKSTKVPLYDGSAWSLSDIGSGLSQATTDATKSPAAVANNSNYDLFVWSDSGTIRLSRGPAWSSDTARGTGSGTTELEQVNGRWVNKVSITNGPGAQRGLYVGTVRSDGSAQLNDSLAKRHVWNTYNRAARPMKVTDSTDNWTWSTAGWHQANASAANQLDIVRGLDEDSVRACVLAEFSNSTATERVAHVGVGLDSTTAFSGLTGTGRATSTAFSGLSASYFGLPGLGRHYLAWLEYGAGSDTQNWRGDNGTPTVLQSGIIGEVLA